MTTNNRVLFVADNNTTGPELWVTDGTLSGTSLVKDIFPGKVGSPSPANFTNIGTKVIFSATDSTHGRELWVTDGTTAGTSMLKDIYAGSTSGSYYAASNANTPSGFFTAGSVKVFSANDGTHGKELWATDGTTAGTTLLADINVGTGSSSLRYFTSFGTRQLFQATDGNATGDHGRELWITDGTAAGTSMVLDIAPGNAAYGDPRGFTDLGSGLAVFSANAGGSVGRELWVTNGSAAGTSLLVNIATGSYGAGSNPGQFTRLGTTGRAVFAGGTAGGYTVPVQLWVTDGTLAGTSALKTFSGGANSGSSAALSSAGAIGAVGDKAVFIGTDNSVTGLWVTDGTSAGTSLLTASVTSIGTPTGSIQEFFALGAKDLFWSGSGAGSTPWVTDGTAAGTFQLSATGQLGSATGFTVAGTKAIFAASSTDGAEPWVTDGTTAGTFELSNINTLTNGSSSPGGFTSLGNKVLFAATDVNHGRELWITDGTSVGTSLLKDINTAYYTHSSSPVSLAAVVLPCFAEGTRLATPTGTVRVEALRAGDMVLTATGEARAVRWIGHRALHRAQPIRIAPDAFGTGRPHAVLRLSPDHAVYDGGVLVPAHLLVNGATITREAPKPVTWYHVELDSHDILLAEGLSCESFLDTGNRSDFANGGPVLTLHPDFHREAWDGACARLVTEGAEIVALRSWLLERAEMLGHAVTRDAGLGVLVDDAPVAPVRTAEGYRLRLPPGARRLRLVSRTAIPAERSEDNPDPRSLGVALTWLGFDGTPVDLGSTALVEGWHDVEPSLRWTRGAGEIDVTGRAEVAFGVLTTGSYWADRPDERRFAQCR